jgi:hypothetical protein
MGQGHGTVLRSDMKKQEELLKTLRMGGSDAVTAFVDNCVSIHEAGGADEVSKWVTVALPELPEPERAALVTLLMDSLLTSYEVEFESYPSNELH